MEGYKTTRYFLILLNVIIFLAGGACAGAGLMFKLDSGVLESSVISMLNLIQYQMIPLGIICEFLAYLMICFGATILIATVVGMCGALKSNSGCLWAFIGLIIFFVVIEAVIIGLWISVWGRGDLWLRGQMIQLLADYAGPQATDKVSSGWNTMFMEARCCGVNDQFKDGGSNSDFTGIPTTWTSGTDKVPATCCQGVSSDTISQYLNSARCTNTPSNFYTEGCYDRFVGYINTYCLIAIITAGTCLVAGVIGIVAACIVIDKAKNRVVPHDAPRKKPQPYVAIDYTQKWKQSMASVGKEPPMYTKNGR
ncbi:Tetraspanin [Mactra antiquata]